MRKKAKKDTKVFVGLGFVVLILVVLTTSKGLFGKGKVLSHNSDNDEGNGYGYSGNGKNGGGGNNQITVTSNPTVIVTTSTPVITVDPTVILTPTNTVVITTPQSTPNPTPTESVVTVTPTDTPVSRNDISENTTHKSLQVVPISERSVVVTDQYIPEPTVTQTVIQSIKKKIEQIGRGEIIKQPKPTPTRDNKKKDEETIEVLKENVSMSYKYANGKIYLGIEDDSGRAVKMSESEIRRVEVSTNINLKNAGINLGLTSGDQFVVSKNGFSSVVNFPISVSLETRKVSIKTPYGYKTVEVFPDEAVGEAIEVINYGGLSGNVLSMELVGQNLAYKVEGKKIYKIGGYIPVEVIERVFVDVSTGDLTKNNQPWKTNLVKLVSVW